MHVAIVFWKCYVLRPRRNFRMARRRRGETERNGKNDYALPRARLLPLRSVACFCVERKRCAAQHSERERRERDEHSQFMTGKDPRRKSIDIALQTGPYSLVEIR